MRDDKYIIYLFTGKRHSGYISIFTKRATIARALHVADAHVAISAHRIDVQASKCAHAPLIRLVHTSPSLLYLIGFGIVSPNKKMEK